MAGVLRCFWCDEPILEDQPTKWIPHLGDSGPAIAKPWHIECFARSMCHGGVNHLKGTCSCCGGTEPPDPIGMTRREAAIAAHNFYGQFQALAERNISRAIRSMNDDDQNECM